jgi:hygromycin-B 7''-O-kinase
MASRIVSQHLGSLSDAQLQAALDRFHLGCFLGAKPVPFGTFGQNVFVSSTEGDYVL